MYEEFTKRGIHVIAVAQEDKDLESHGKFTASFETPPPFDIVANLERGDADPYKRTCGYYIDKQGVVRQVFPNTIRYRADWDAVLSGIDQARKKQNAGE